MTKLPVLALLCSSLLLPLAAHAGDGCDGLPNWQQLKQALANARKDTNGGFNLDMWGTVVATDGTVCAVAAQLPGLTQALATTRDSAS